MGIRDFRCCMCPQRDKNTTICPVGPGKTEETTCDFVITWTDKRGWKYRVMSGIGNTYKGRYQDNQHSGQTGWKGMRQLPWRENFDEAQEDLNKYASSKNWTPSVSANDEEE